jgi:hypothetical protein
MNRRGKQPRHRIRAGGVTLALGSAESAKARRRDGAKKAAKNSPFFSRFFRAIAFSRSLPEIWELPRL